MSEFLSVITCHPDSTEVPALRHSLKANLGFHDTELLPIVGAESIAKAYNEGAVRSSGKMLIFTHSDVEILTSRAMMQAAVSMASQSDIGVVGIAGGKVLREKPVWWGVPKELSGACMHTDGRKWWMTSFGPYGRVAVLDGVFLMCRRDVWEKLRGFDEEFPGWDYYDIDFTLRSHLAGFVNATYPLHILHHSIGDVTKKTGWHENQKRFIQKWGDVLPVAL